VVATVGKPQLSSHGGRREYKCSQSSLQNGHSRFPTRSSKFQRLAP
jgi:hypothetical protein